MPTRIVLAAVTVLLAASTPAMAWGGTGHSVVAEIAQRHLSPATRRKIAALLGDGVSLASVSSWADTRAMLDPATRRWHFVNIPVNAERYEPARDCAQEAGGDCIINAIERQRRILADRRASRAARADAIRYLVHFIADLHQPLHCATRDGDAGGTLLKVEHFGQTLPLHLVWDFAILDKASFDWGEHLRRVNSWLEAQDRRTMLTGDVAAWAWEAHTLAVSTAYRLPADLKLGDDYQSTALPVIHGQLGKAGVRLAAILRQALNPR